MKTTLWFTKTGTRLAEYIARVNAGACTDPIEPQSPIICAKGVTKLLGYQPDAFRLDIFDAKTPGTSMVTLTNRHVTSKKLFSELIWTSLDDYVFQVFGYRNHMNPLYFRITPIHG